MGSLPPSSVREFEKRIMVSRGGIEYMAGGTEFPSYDWTTSLGRQSKSNTKIKNPGEEKRQKQTPSPPDADVSLT